VNLFFVVFQGISGLIIGFFTPHISDKVMKAKCLQRDKEIPPNQFRNKIVHGFLCIINSAFWTAASFLMENPLSAFFISLLFTLALLFAMIDFSIHLIPNEMVLITLFVGILFQFTQFGWKDLLIAFVCMFAMMLLFTLVGFLVGLGKVGAGDIKLAGIMGIALGYPALLTAVLVMSAAIIAYCFFGIWFRKLTLVSMFPFAPFMMLGMTASLSLILFQS
jgi:leader peptidase (prepilin peptidase)/N-methyltransferase